MGKKLTSGHINKVLNEISTPESVATESELKKEFPTVDTLTYIKNDTYTANIDNLLGKVYILKKNGDEQKIYEYYINVDVEVDENSRLKTPQKVSGLIVDSKNSFSADVLSIIGVNISNEELLELRIMNNSAFRINESENKLLSGVRKWNEITEVKVQLQKQDFFRIGVVTGVVQKFCTTKKFKKFEGSVKVGAWGLNVGGSLYTSTTQFDLAVVYGLDLRIIKENEGEFESVMSNDLEIESDTQVIKSFVIKIDNFS